MARQVLMSPNRKMLDAAHAKGVTLDIGLPSLRNFYAMAWYKKIAWIILTFSSLPLHFL
jgi:hypothetical protein